MGDLSKTNKITGSGVSQSNCMEKRISIGNYQILIVIKPVEKSKFDIDSFYWTENSKRSQLHKFVFVPSEFLLSTVKSMELEIKKMFESKSKAQIFDFLLEAGFEVKGRIEKSIFIDTYL